MLDEVAEWQNRSLKALYPLVFLDAIRVKFRDGGTVRNKAVHVSIGVRADGAKEVLGLRIEGAKFWLRVINEPRERGVEDILIAVVDGVKGFPEAIAAFPTAQVQACIVHLLRHSRDFVSRGAEEALPRPQRRGRQGGARRLRGRPSGPQVPSIAQSSRRHWTEVILFYAYPAEVRRIVHTTDPIEAAHAKLAARSGPAGTSPTTRPR